ncbi:unnamed protein product [Nezara viridula]|uniref:Uncharacterized protein n=1 Tax=Nezara viridula TaxID=85310 RepID=A0A9P0HSB3_NEZVI|nr:unnamed protein product [Nezara viridula]
MYDWYALDISKFVSMSLNYHQFSARWQKITREIKNETNWAGARDLTTFVFISVALGVVFSGILPFIAYGFGLQLRPIINLPYRVPLD